MDQIGEISIAFGYGAARANLRVSYDPGEGVLTIRGGRHGYSMLAEVLSGLARVTQGSDDHHFLDGNPKDPLLTIVANAVYWER